VVGLGNPGLRYRATRHNAGFFVVDRLAKSRRARFRRKFAHSVVASIEVGGRDALLVKPRCFMNRSGMALGEILAGWGDETPDFLVVYDDFHLDAGRIRFRGRGSAGGHNGMQSILDALETDEIPRLRIGVGSPAPGEDPAEYVLAPVPRPDREPLARAVDLAAEAVEFWLRGGTLQECMNRYNGSARIGEDGASRTGS
jgi:PTH1 family peptidyl-tRNA hydrolase